MATSRQNILESAIFGPVPSRRLGRSLGVDPVPFKTCNWSCAYCQLGLSSPVETERKSYIPVQKILGDLDLALASLGQDAIDWITIAGSGEPTLHSEIGAIVEAVTGYVH